MKYVNVPSDVYGLKIVGGRLVGYKKDFGTWSEVIGSGLEIESRDDSGVWLQTVSEAGYSALADWPNNITRLCNEHGTGDVPGFGGKWPGE